jgi:hypothetical protein
VVRKEMKNVECPPVHSFHAFEVVQFEFLVAGCVIRFPHILDSLV